jgi:hypothetical protein
VLTTSNSRHEALGGKSGRHVERGVDPGSAIRRLVLRQHAREEPVSPPAEGLAHAGNSHQIDADADD